MTAPNALVTKLYFARLTFSVWGSRPRLPHTEVPTLSFEDNPITKCNWEKSALGAVIRVNSRLFVVAVLCVFESLW
jgi:hypothetical protein